MGTSESDQISSNRKLSFLTACVFIIGEVAGGGILSLPHSTSQSGWYGIGLIIYCAFASAVSGICISKSWLIIEERYPEYRNGLTRKAFSIIGYYAFGKYASVSTSILIDVTKVGSGTVFILLTSTLIHSITKSFITLTECQWILVIPLICYFPYLLGSPGDFWLIGYLAMGTSTIGSILLLITLATDLFQHGFAQDFHIEGVDSFVSAYGVFVFAFSGITTFPNFQNDMKERNKFPGAVSLSYVILVFFYVPIAALGYATRGASVTANITDSLSNHTMTMIIRSLFLLHCFSVIFITTCPLVLDVEELFNIPKRFGWKRVLIRTILLTLMTFIALTFPSFGELLNLISSTTYVLLAAVFPIGFYIKLCHDHKKNVQWKQRNLSYPLLATFAIVIISTIIAGIASTYSTLKHFTSLKSACYLSNWNVTEF